MKTVGGTTAAGAAWHTLSPASVAGIVQVSLEAGLAEREARARLEKTGPNRLPGPRRKGFWEEFLEELREPLILLLLGTGVLYILWGEPAEAITVFCVILALNTIAVLNERRAGKAVSALRKLAEPTALVVREGRSREVPAEQLVPGDVVVLQAGRRVPADGRLAESVGLAVDESSLTGESVPVAKEAGATLSETIPLAEQANRVFAGTLVTRGRGRAVVVATGPATELGRVVGLARTVEEPRTPLQQAMGGISRSLLGLALGFSVLIPVLGVLLAGQPLKAMLLTGLSLAFATIPEELPIIINLVLALGAYRLSRRQAIVKRLAAVETLGAVTVIATDKTGTLTENRLEVREVVPEANRPLILTAGVLCTDALREGGELRADPLERALIRAAGKEGLEIGRLEGEAPRVNEFSFDNVRRRMSVIRRDGASFRVWVKGAPESLLARSRERVTAAGLQPLEKTSRREILETASRLAAGGLRVIALAEKRAGSAEITEPEAERDLRFLGLVGLADPPRAEVSEAVRLTRGAGIRSVMITGDHPVTARAIAAQAGLAAGGGPLLTGPELDALGEEALRERVGEVSVYARTTPEHKLRIVRALRKRGERVAVTGDGVNDTPALAAADIGVAMGGRGSDAAREAADIVLADDNYATIARAVREGRGVFENLKKGVRYYLAVKAALVLVTLLPVLLRVPVPFSPIQIILMELFMDLAAAAAFTLEPPEGDLMRRPPRHPRAPFMDRAMIGGIFTAAAGLSAAVSAAYLLAWYGGAGLATARTAAFTAWLLGHVLLAVNLRSERQSALQAGLFANRLMVFWGLGTGVFALLATLLPPLQAALQTTPLSAGQWLLILALSAAGTFWMELRKLATKSRAGGLP